MQQNETEKKNSNVDTEILRIDYGKLVPIITASIVLLGIIRLFVFYYFINVPILSYLDFSEIVTSFLDVLIAGVVTVVCQIAIVSLFPQVHFKVDKELLKSDKTELEKLRSKRKALRQLTLICIIGLVVFVSYMVYIDKLKAVLIFCTIIVVTFSIMYVYSKTRTHPIKFMKELVIPILVFVVFSFYSCLSAYIGYDAIIKDYITLGTRIVFNEQTVIKDGSHTFTSDSTHVYYGKTHNYIITYDVKEKVANIYPVANVLQINLKLKNSGKVFQ